MPHITDGQLHAHLDGATGALAPDGALHDGPAASEIEAHLHTCADCRARLEAERAVRTAAGLILADAGTTVEVPPFEQLLREAPADAARPRARSWLPLAWAASLVLAMGGGWWVASMSGPVARLAQTVESALGDAPDAPLATAVEKVATTPDYGEPDVMRRAQVAQADAPAADEAALSAADAGALSAGDAAALHAGAAARPLGEPMASRVAAEHLAATPAGVTGARTEAAARVDVAAAPVTRSPMPPTAVRTAAAPPVRSEQPEREQQLRAGVDVLHLPTPPSSLVEVTRATGSDPAGWSRLQPWQGAHGGVPVLVVADGGAASAEFRVDSILGTVVRVQQQLDDGAAVELLVWQARNTTAAGFAAGAVRSIAPRLQAQADAAGSVRVAEEVLPGGDQRLVVFLPGRNLFVALRGDQAGGLLAELAERLVERR
jgi:hypothetical protein